MNTHTFINLMTFTFDNLKQLSASKGIEYAGEDDRLSNFKDQGKLLGLQPMQILGVYLNKHLGSINKFIKERPQQLSEPIEGRIDDAILYLILLKAMVKEEQTIMVGTPTESLCPRVHQRQIPASPKELEKDILEGWGQQ